MKKYILGVLYALVAPFLVYSIFAVTTLTLWPSEPEYGSTLRLALLLSWYVISFANIIKP